MKRKQLIIGSILIIFSFCLLVLIVLISSKIFFKPKVDGACPEISNHIEVVIENNTMLPNKVSAKKCDEITVTNKDKAVRNMAFGVHDKHQPYNGMSGAILEQNKKLSFTLAETGNYVLHDHNDERVELDFTVQATK